MRRMCSTIGKEEMNIKFVRETEGLTFPERPKCRRDNIKTDIEGEDRTPGLDLSGLGCESLRGVVNTVTDIWVP